MKMLNNLNEEFENSQKIKHLLGIFNLEINLEDITFLLERWWFLENGEVLMKSLKTLNIEENVICFPKRVFNNKINNVWEVDDNTKDFFLKKYVKIKETEKESYYIIKNKL